MKVALDLGEKLEVAILEGNRVVGSLSLVLNGFGAVAVKVAEAAAAPKKGKAKAAAKAKAEPKKRGKRTVSAESRIRMAEAQKLRWAKKKGAPEAPPVAEG